MYLNMLVYVCLFGKRILFCSAQPVRQVSGVRFDVPCSSLRRGCGLQGGGFHGQEQRHTLPGLQTPALQQVRMVLYVVMETSQLSPVIDGWLPKAKGLGYDDISVIISPNSHLQ